MIGLKEFMELKRAAIYDSSGLGLNYFNLFCAILFIDKKKK